MGGTGKPFTCKKCGRNRTAHFRGATIGTHYSSVEFYLCFHCCTKLKQWLDRKITVTSSR